MRMRRVRALAGVAHLLEAAQLPRWVEVAAADGVGDFADVDIAVRVDGDAVGGNEIAGVLAFLGGAVAAEEAAPDAPPPAEGGMPGTAPPAAAQGATQ